MTMAPGYYSLGCTTGEAGPAHDYWVPSYLMGTLRACAVKGPEGCTWLVADEQSPSQRPGLGRMPRPPLRVLNPLALIRHR